MKIWLLSPTNLILGDILRTLAFSEFFFDEKKLRLRGIGCWLQHQIPLPAGGEGRPPVVAGGSWMGWNLRLPTRQNLSGTKQPTGGSLSISISITVLVLLVLSQFKLEFILTLKDFLSCANNRFFVTI